MPIANQKGWDICVKNNESDYGKAGVDVAREVMRLLDEKKDFDASDIILEADRNVHNGVGELTGFLSGCVAGIVAACHSRGEEFNDKWNKYWGVSKEEAKGKTLNPALMTTE